MKQKGLVFVVSAPSGAGKTTLCRAISRIFPDLHFSISYTTRPPRSGDVNGRDYHFITPEKFREMNDRGELAEWAEIYGHRYGTSRILLEKVLEEGQDVILDIDGQGARQLREKKLPGIFIFLLPPSLGELEQRLSHRNTEGKMAMEERLRKAKVEMAEARFYDYLIVNDELEKAKEQLKAIILAEHCRRERMNNVLEDILTGK
ncbi:MAG: guanylate kinase [Thermodesulfobacteriota bacterium]|nr:guanylate kinase [Thermodesulfobacteriota bacterium]